ncbi:hypothetical protein [Verrucomicrobium sp. BvORR034]|uniref:hypothetical protein n=1 Tax=Verrucomicrobium sp. BvORR034 TaxID=1396418 RepID=UPI0006787DB1|nr:hypothetical protein [Verrucomicrobium sp. BvORR034]
MGDADGARESPREMREVRGRMAQVVWGLRRLCREEEKGRSRELGLSAPWVLAVARARLQQGLADCEMLDGLVQERLARGEGERGREPWPRYVAGYCWCPPDAAAEAEDAASAAASSQSLTGLVLHVHRLTLRECQVVSQVGRSARAAAREGDAEKAMDKRLLHRVRERLRDGFPPKNALAYYASDIQARHEAGRVQFAIDLGRELEQALRKPERYQRSTSDWLLRLWLPLRFWECPANGETAYHRFTQAAKLLGQVPVGFPAFLTAWRNGRARFAGKPVRQ